MKFDCLVVGAGISGSTAARTLAEAGKKVLVMEQLKHIAGHCHDYLSPEGITVHTYGPHIFHTNNRDAWNYLNRFTEFRHFQHRVLSYADGLLIPFPINMDTINMVYGTSITAEEVAGFLEKEVNKSVYKDPPGNFRDAVVSQVGERLYNLFFKNYTIKQWERNPEELSPEVARRIPVRANRDNRYFSDQYQGIPSGGYTKMIEKMLDHENISLMTGADYFRLGDTVSALLDEKNSLTVYTGELDRFFKYKYGELEYRSLDIKFKTVDMEQYQDAAVVNYPNDYDFTRITEFKHMTGEKSDKTVICMEYPMEKGEPYYVVLTETNMEKREKYIKETGILEKSGKFIFTGRLAEYKYYNMDQAVAAGLEKIRKYLNGKEI
ncbi:MAG: UDP-galactopyranose mutase [Spirochaetales bacterium]|nr:UDP-galactopyranose mutase [Spirochaetales bacterium]